ncbi:MAG TPA: hypothetical protein VJ801_12560 [Polyangia bacterium]|jgi:hypothetical protein|nr:hypothetical protein [Polyangia bacterium]
MADRQSLREMLSHRVTFTYDTGAQVVGTVSACAPVAGPVEYVVLARVEVKGAAGQVLARFAELPLVPNNLVGIAVTEGAL